MRLPVWTGPPPEAPGEEPLRLASESDLEEIRVLVAEDEGIIGMMLVDQLHEEGHQAEYAADGDEARVLFAAGRFHVAILDLAINSPANSASGTRTWSPFWQRAGHSTRVTRAACQLTSICRNPSPPTGCVGCLALPSCSIRIAPQMLECAFVPARPAPGHLTCRPRSRHKPREIPC